jgi:large subunit ribosomal protein L3
VQSLEVISADAERGLLMLKGAVPGHKGGFVLVKDAVKRKTPEGLPFPAAVRAAPEAAPTESETAPAPESETTPAPEGEQR